MKIELHFVGTAEPELTKVKSTLPGTAEIISLRGIYALSADSVTFPWSGAVHALTLLLLRAAELGDSAEPHLTGERDTPASSLDYALSKHPRWLREMFGETSSGESKFSSLVAVTNRNGKRQGEISLRFRSPRCISVILNSHKLSTNLELSALREKLEHSWQPHGKRSVRNIPQSVQTGSSTESVVKTVTDLMFIEAERTLSTVDVFNRTKLAARLNALVGDPSFRQVAGNCTVLLNQHEGMLTSSERCGAANMVAHRAILEQSGGLDVAVSMASIGARCIFTHLQTVSGFPLRIDSSFVHALEIGSRILNRDPLLTHDICAIASAPAASLIANRSKHEYEPVMLLPAVSQRIVTPNSRGAAVGGRRFNQLSLLYENPSTASFYFDRLTNEGVMKRKNLKLLHQEPWEAAASLATGDPTLSSILFFPYAELNVKYNDCRFIEIPENAPGIADLVLFAHSGLIKNKPRLRAILAAIRFAWQDLLGEKRFLRSAVEVALAEPQSLANLLRGSGLSQLRQSAGLT